MIIEPGTLADDDLLKRSAEARHPALLGSRASRQDALILERDVRKRFTAFHSAEPESSADERPPRSRRWMRIKR